MGPFVPDIITDELNLIFGFLIGIAFGFVLEQAGFSSTRKLTGLFYGRDFTVLRVFFTAAITAMSGIVLLAYFGLLDTEIIYINPTYLWAAIIGGGIMGVGFVAGGYCPGTSVCAAAIGKIDAMFFIAGGVIGVFLFGEFYSPLEQLFNGYYMGDITVPAALGISPGLFTLMIIVVAVAAFLLTTKIEQRINPHSESKFFPTRLHNIAAVSILLIGVVLLTLPDRKARLLSLASDPEYGNTRTFRTITSDELAFRILDGDKDIIIIDVRDSASFAAMALPGAINIPKEEMFGKQWNEILGNNKLKILIGEDIQTEKNAFVLTELMGFKRFSILDGGMQEFRHTIFSVTAEPGSIPATMQDTYRFRSQAKIELTKMMKEQSAGAIKPVKQVKKVAGGCGA